MEVGSRVDKRYILGAQTRRHPSGFPLGTWIESFADQKGQTVQEVSEDMKLPKKALNRIRLQKRPTVDTLSKVLQSFGNAGVLSDTQQNELADAVEATIQGVLERYGSLVELSPVRVKALQEEEKFSCKTFTSAQAAGEIGISNSAVNRWRNKLGLSYLLTMGQVKLIASQVKNKEVKI